MDPFVGEIRVFAGNFAPVGWQLCNGQLLKIADYEALYSLYGTTFGGDGVTTFGVPNLQMQLAVGQYGTKPPGMIYAYPQGVAGGQPTVTVTAATMPTHTHPFNATLASATTTTPGTAVMYATLPSGTTNYLSVSSPTLVNMNVGAVTTAGGNQAHTNMMPTICLTYIVCTNGLYPTLNN